MRVPFVDLGAQYRRYKEDFNRAISDVVEKSGFVGGDAVRTFEAQYAEAYGVKHCISCGNGTDAIYIVLRMLGVGPGDEVITTASSWISTSEAITQTGAKPVFVDVDEFYNINPDLIEKSITGRTRAVIPVHLYGQAADMVRIQDICRRNNLKVVEDCAQAHFAEFSGSRVGTFGDAGTFSFYPGKNLGAWGDAGAVVTNDNELACRCRMFANHGALTKHCHEMEGINSRLDGIQAALLSAKLPHIHEWTESRRRVAELYSGLLSGLGDLVLPRVRNGATHVYHLYVVRTKVRDALREFLSVNGIETGIHYPTALPLLPAYRYLGSTESDFKGAARNQSEVLSLPIYPEMTGDMVQYVANTIKMFFSRA